MRYIPSISLRVSVAALLLLSLVTVAFVSAPAVRATPEQGEHLVTIHDRGQKRSVISNADTLGEVFEQAGISVDPNDIVEPGLDKKLLASSYQVNVYRAQPVTIVDGATKVRIMSAYQTPRQIIEHAGIDLQNEDSTSTEISDNAILDGASTRLVIDRATPIQLVLYGKNETVYTQATTVADFLKEKGITLEKDDTMSAQPSDTISHNMKLQIWRNGVQTVTVDEAIEPEVEKIYDTNREKGYEEVKEAGKPGKKSVTYEITMRDGREVERKEIQKVVIEQPQKRVIVIGAKQQVFGGTCAEWMAAAGIDDTANATYLINAESGCNPNAVNPSSGACGVGQALPCSKTGCEMGDGACQTRWMNGYVMGRYGSWQAAADHHRSKGWY